MDKKNIFEPDNLITGGFLRLTESVTVVSEDALPRGAVLGKIRASGKYNLAKKAAADGTETPIAILAEELPAGTGDKTAMVYITGEFSINHITLGEGMDKVTAKEALHLRSIFLQETI